MHEEVLDLNDENPINEDTSIVNDEPEKVHSHHSEEGIETGSQ